MFWRAWNPSLNCTDFNSASLNTWLTNTAKQSITVALSKKCNLFSVYGTGTCGTCFSFTVYLFQFIQCTFYFLFCWLSPPSHDTPFTSDSWKILVSCKQALTVCESRFEKRSWKYPSWRKGCTFCPYLPEHQRLHMELGANHAEVFLWSQHSAWHKG